MDFCLCLCLLVCQPPANCLLVAVLAAQTAHSSQLVPPPAVFDFGLKPLIPPCDFSSPQIQTVKTQEMNLLREQQEALTAELQQRRAEHDGLLAQRDDLDSQLQVTNTISSTCFFFFPPM